MGKMNNNLPIYLFKHISSDPCLVDATYTICSCPTTLRQIKMYLPEILSCTSITWTHEWENLALKISQLKGTCPMPSRTTLKQNMLSVS